VPERFFSNQSSKTSDRSNHNHQSNQPIEQQDQSSFRDIQSPSLPQEKKFAAAEARGKN
jgi:hypothetical protein